MGKTDYNITFKIYKKDKKKKYREYKIFINDFETRYSIRGDGNIYSCNYRNSGERKKLKPGHNKDGYCFAHISCNGKDYSILLHKLVAMAFIKNPNNLAEVNHKNLNKDDNCYKNLEWVTRRDNIHHAIKNSAIPFSKGEKHGMSKLKNKEVHEICKMLENNYSIKDISTKTGVSKHTIFNILHKKQWTSISEYYNFTNHSARGNTKLTEKDVHEICKMYIKTDLSMAQIAKKFNITKEAVQSIIRGKNWVKISSQYKFNR